MAGASPPPLAPESNAGLRVDFQAASGQQHGFDDGSQYPASRQALEVLSIAGQEYRVPWKSIRAWNPDPVEATTTDLDSTADHQPVVFRLGPGNIQPIDNGQGLTLWLSPGGSQHPLALEALHGDQPAGRLNIATYDQKVHRLVIVPLGSQVTPPDPLVIRQELDRVYAQAVTAWEVSIDPPLVGKDIPGIDSPLETSGQQSWSAYSPQMNTVIQALLANRNVDPAAAYIFLAKEPTTSIAGYMPLGRRYGFMFTRGVSDDAALARLIAHELGHGAFKLRHTFSSENPYHAPQGTTHNLMDYNNGVHLAKHQWENIQSPLKGLHLFEDEGEGEYSMPCVGWFDDCKTVLQILERFRSARINGNNMTIKGQANNEERVLVANFVKVGDTDYKKLRLMYKPKTDDYALSPFKYDHYDQQFFAADGSVDRQRGFVYYKDKEALFKILVDDEESKLENLKDYLFGKDYDEIKAILTNNSVLTPDEIKSVREQIAMLKDEDQKKELYLELQTKVPYHNQRNNTSTLKKVDTDENIRIGDVMCGLTSMAMALEVLGLKNPCLPDPDQFEDCIETKITYTSSSKFNFSPLNDGNKYNDAREWYDGRLSALKAMYGEQISVGNKEFVVKDEIDDIKNFLSEKLEKGYGVMVSYKGHFIRIKSSNDTQFIYDDPYGSYSITKDKARKWDSYNSTSDENGVGQNNIRKWNDYDVLQSRERFYIEYYYYENK